MNLKQIIIDQPIMLSWSQPFGIFRQPGLSDDTVIGCVTDSIPIYLIMHTEIDKYVQS